MTDIVRLVKSISALEARHRDPAFEIPKFPFPFKQIYPEQQRII